MKSIGSITETVEDLVARIDLNAEYIPKFARWQAQLLIMDDIKGDENFEDVLSAIQQLQHLELVAAFLEDLDPLMDEAFTREVNKLFIRGLILITIIPGGFAATTFLGVRALKRERGS